MLAARVCVCVRTSDGGLLYLYIHLSCQVNPGIIAVFDDGTSLLPD